MSCSSGRCFAVCFTVWIFLCHKAFADLSSVSDFNFPVTDGPVNVALETNGILYVGGAFTQIGPHTGAFAPVSPDTGTLAGPAAYFGGAVACSLPDGQGGVFVGGNFVTVGSVLTTNLAHIRADKTLDPSFRFTADAGVAALTIYSNRLFVGGSFSAMNGQTRSNLAAVDLETSQVESFSFAIDGPVNALATSSNLLYVGGSFLNINGVARSYLGAIDLSAATLTSWNPSPDSTYSRGINLLSVADGRLYAAGDFSQIANSARNSLAAFDPVSGMLLDWDAQVGPNLLLLGVETVVVSSNTVYLGGNFGQLGAQARTQIGAVDKDTGAVLPWSPFMPYGSVHTLAVSGSVVYVGGDFPSLATNGPQRLAAVDATTGTALPWAPVPGGPVSTLLPIANWIYVGGAFDSVGGVNRQLLAAIDLSTRLPTSWNANIAGNGATGDFVSGLAATGDTLFIGGRFGGIGGQPRSSLGAVHLPDGAVLPFKPTLSGQVFGLCLAGTNVVLARISVPPPQGLLVFDTLTGHALTWNFGADGVITAVAAANNAIYIGGGFRNAGGQPRSNLAAFDANTHQLLPWNPSVDSGVSQLAVRDQTVIAYGTFLHANGQSRTNLAAFDGVSGDLALGPSVFVADGGISFMAISPTAFYAAGTFNTVNQAPRSHYAALDLLTSQPLSWDPGISALLPGYQATRAQVVPTSDRVILCGPFTAIGGTPRMGLASFAIVNPPPQVQIVTPTNNTVLHIPAQVSLLVQATSSSSAISRIDLYSRTDLLASATSGELSNNWVAPKQVGDYLLTAVAYDQSGQPAFSPASRVSVQPPEGYIAPTITITVPQSNATYSPYNPLIVQADVAAPSSTVEHVQFFVGTSLTATRINPPYSFTMTNLAPGTNSVSAILRDEFGVTASAGPIDFRIDKPPQVTLTSPPNGYTTIVGGKVQFSATASDSDGSISSVTFYNGTAVVGSVTNPPYSLSSSNIPIGSYNFTAVATDNFGIGSTSKVANVKIYPPVQFSEFVDNSDPNVSFGGAWSIGSVADVHFGPNYAFTSCSAGAATATAVYVPSIPTNGFYDIYLLYPQLPNASSNAQWTISYNGGITNVLVDQAHYFSQRILLASGLSFTAGTNGFIELSNSGGQTDQVVVADAILVQSSLVPYVIDQPQSQVVKAGQPVTFNIGLTGSPPVSVQWEFNGVELPGAKSSSLSFSAIQYSNAGMYSVTVKNPISSTTSSNAYLTVLPPSVPKLLASSAITNNQINFTLLSDPGVSFDIEASTNLVDWFTFDQVLISPGSFPFSDSYSNSLNRFYRAKWLP